MEDEQASPAPPADGVSYGGPPPVEVGPVRPGRDENRHEPHRLRRDDQEGEISRDTDIFARVHPDARQQKEPCLSEEEPHAQFGP